jgi:hypothetical protein
MVRRLLATSVVLAASIPMGAASAADTISVFTPSVPIYTTSSSTPCLEVKQGGATYNPSTGAWTVQPVTVRFTSVSDCL